jgi:hypothetical protein
MSPESSSVISVPSVVDIPALLAPRLRMPPDKLVHAELSESIIGAAMTVLNELKPGLDEKLYESALVIELGKRGLTAEYADYAEGTAVGATGRVLVPC